MVGHNEIGADGKNHLIDRIGEIDGVITELQKYRLSLCVMREYYDHMSVLEDFPDDEFALRLVVRNCLDLIDLQILKDFAQ